VSLNDSTKTLNILSDETEAESYYGTDFSPKAGFYLLSYEGPGIPWQKVIDVEDEGM
jgi:dipeptidyl aminopeptidase B